MEKKSNMKKVISISVWGDSPRYCVGAIKNAEIAQKIFPDWTCRIFVDDSVPSKYLDSLNKMSNVEIAEINDEGIFGAFWRFYSMFESEDCITISRDSDSRISVREAKIIDEWLQSDKKFSIIRDHERHYDWPILAGMWGMKGLLDGSLMSKIREYGKNHFYTSDQIFLAKEIWPIAQNDCVIHGFKEVQWMNESRKNVRYDFIGQGYDENDNPIYEFTENGNIVTNG